MRCKLARAAAQGNDSARGREKPRRVRAPGLRPVHPSRGSAGQGQSRLSTHVSLQPVSCEQPYVQSKLASVS